MRKPDLTVGNQQSHSCSLDTLLLLATCSSEDPMPEPSSVATHGSAFRTPKTRYDLALKIFKNVQVSNIPPPLSTNLLSHLPFDLYDFELHSRWMRMAKYFNIGEEDEISHTKMRRECGM